MEIHNQSGQKYLAKVKRRLKCSSGTRENFLETLRPELHNFELENPDADYADYIAEFGEPKAAAQKYMDELSDSEVFGYWKPIIIAMVIAVAALLIGMACFFVAHRKDSVPVYYEDGTPLSGSDLEIFLDDSES